MIEILFFGRLGDASETLRVSLPYGVEDTESLTQWLSKQNSALGLELSRSGNRVAVNKKVIAQNTEVNEGDEIAYMSPLSGG